MAEKKDIKLNIKNNQIAKAIQLDKLKKKLANKKADSKEAEKPESLTAKPSPRDKKVKEDAHVVEKEETPRRKARSKSVFAEPEAKREPEEQFSGESPLEETVEEVVFADEDHSVIEEVKEVPEVSMTPVEEELPETVVPEQAPVEVAQEVVPPKQEPPKKPREVLGPTGRHIKDLLPPKFQPKKAPPPVAPSAAKEERGSKKEVPGKPKPRPAAGETDEDFEAAQKRNKAAKFKEFKDLKPAKKQPSGRFDARDRRGLGSGEEDSRWRKKKHKSDKDREREDLTIRPSTLTVRLPIVIKDLAVVMKLKASQLIQKLFLQGIPATINDILSDETTIQLLGEEFGCQISIDTSEEERIRITDQSIKEEIKATDPDSLETRAPVVTFMGHVDHGKTSLIDYIRQSNTVQGEAGKITQHIGAFKVETKVGPIAILDTPGHEAFSSMRARGADVTDIVVLVIAGDEGMRAQTEEAINHAKAAGVTIVVAMNKCDKPNFDAEKVYRQLADHELLPEAWGGQIITVRCSAVTGEGIGTLLEMLALQAEVLELKANPSTRARGNVLESEMHKGLGAVATILVQNGTLRIGDPVVFEAHWGRVKTMRDEFGNNLTEASPSTPVEITGLSGLPAAGEEFIVVSSEKEAREISEARQLDIKQSHLQMSKAKSLESLLQQAADKDKKILKIVLRADVQGSLEALKVALMKIESDKAEIDIISSGVGEISESDVLLAAASNAIILGFHTQVESHAEQLLKQYDIHVSQHDIIYHAIDDVKALMTGMLDKIAQENEKGKALVKAVFKASQLGKIAGCQVTEGSINRNNYIRLVRGGKVIWKGTISSLKRVQEDVREVQKGVECGILLSNNNNIEEGDILEAYEIVHIAQEL